MFLFLVIVQLQLTMIKLLCIYATTMKTTKIFHLHFCLILRASFKERKGFTGTQVVKPWLKILKKF